jgi:15-cis-phytoene synthase
MVATEDVMAALNLQAWERPLVSMAYEAWHPAVPRTPVPVSDSVALQRAYAYCESLIAEHGRTFYLASSLLPADKRRAIRALYAFCRVTDDIVDRPERNAEEALAAWRREVISARPPRDDLVGTAWADTRLRYRIPHRYAEQLIEGVARDLRRQRYATFDELAAYSYGVASTVGLMSMHIIGMTRGGHEEAIPYVVKLGVALQITNILRDVGEDWRAGRVYLPGEELAAFGLTDADLAAGRVDDRWRTFMRFQVERNRKLYEEAWPGIAFFNRDGRFAVAAACQLYSAILGDIEAHDYDVFNRRAHVSTWGKLGRLPGIWRRNRS